jgi:hypothetical protein
MPKLLQDGLGGDADTQAFERLGSVFLLLRRAAPDSFRGDGSGFLIGAVRVGGVLDPVRRGRHLRSGQRLRTPAGSRDSKVSSVSK